MKTVLNHTHRGETKYFIVNRDGNKSLGTKTYQCYFTNNGEIAFLREDEMSCAHCRRPIRYQEKNYVMKDEKNKDKRPKKPRLEELVERERPYTHLQLHGYDTEVTHRKKKGTEYLSGLYTDDLTGADLEYFKEYGEVRPHRKTNEQKKAPLLGTRTTQTNVYCSKCFPKIKAAEEL